MRTVGLLLMFCLTQDMGASLWAQSEKPIDAMEALQSLRDKKEFEERELRRLEESVLIPAGEFVMGSAGSGENARPAHTVYLDAFHIDKFEVTQLQYLTVMGKNPSYFKDCPLCPVEKVIFSQAFNYCARKGKRLPTEAEWEKAARGGTSGTFYWGDDMADWHAWFGDNSGGRSQPVGQRTPNAYGLFDMAGNVWEWVQDWYDKNYYTNSPVKDPRGARAGKMKVIRGAAWGNGSHQLDSSYRDFREPDTRYINVGFRCASDVKDL